MKPRILVVDDDLRIRSALASLLAARCEVDLASSAEAAAALLEVQPYQAVLSDLRMPGHDGIWLLHVAAERQPAARRVLMSFDDVACDQFPFVQKPPRLDVLIDLLLSPGA